jgi:2-dehydro-3-deoxyphosphooctonate aldolase (KDO 8-P synthase)
VVESEQLQMDTAGTLKEITSSLGIPFIFKSSYDKANRSSGTSFRGPGMARGLEILAKVKKELGVPILTDVHSERDCRGRQGGDVLQTPLSRAGRPTSSRSRAIHKPVNIEGPVLAPRLKNVIDKARAAARGKRLRLGQLFMACERGASFGYNNSCPTCARWRSCGDRRAGGVRRHALGVQLPGGQGTSSAVTRNGPVLARGGRGRGRGCSWKHISIPPRRCPTVPTPCRSQTHEGAAGNCRRWMRSPRKTATSKTTFSC